jgi:hypothetical protein
MASTPNIVINFNGLDELKETLDRLEELYYKVEEIVQRAEHLRQSEGKVLDPDQGTTLD